MSDNQIPLEPPNPAGYPIGTPLPSFPSDHLPLKTNFFIGLMCRNAQMTSPTKEAPVLVIHNHHDLPQTLGELPPE